MAVFIPFLVGIALVGGLTLYALRGRPVQPAPAADLDAPMPEDALLAALRTLARASTGKGRAALRFSRAEADAMVRERRALARQPGAHEDPAAAFLLRESRAVEEQLRALRFALRRPPRLPKAPGGGPRLLQLGDLILRAGAEPEALPACLRAWAEGCSFTVSEADALPLALRLSCLRALRQSVRDAAAALRETRRGQALAKRMTGTARDPLSLLDKSEPTPEALCACLRRLEDLDAAALLRETETRLAQRGADCKELLSRVLAAEALRGRRAAALSGFLADLARCPWAELTESVDPVHRVLSQDPSGVYPRMTRESRRLYCRRAARLGLLMGMEETRVALGAVQLCAEAAPDGVHDHVGFYLLEAQGERALWGQLHLRRGLFPALLLLKRHRLALLRAGLWLAALAELVLFVALRLPLFWLVPWLLSLSAPLHALARLLRPLSPLPSLRPEALTEAQRTLVVLPVVLSSPHQALQAVAKLSACFHADPDPNIEYLLLGDFPRSMTREQMDDPGIIRAAAEAVQAQSEDGPGRFFYLQRQRWWDRDLGQFRPREGQKGALESLSRLIAEGQCADAFDHVTTAPDFLHRRYAFVVALREDTAVLPDTPRRLVSALSHPLIRRRMLDGTMRGATLLSPQRVADGRASTRLARLLAPSAFSGVSLPPQDALCGVFTPEDLVEETRDWFRPDAPAGSAWIAARLSGVTEDPALPLPTAIPQGWSAALSAQHEGTRQTWLLLPWLLPFVKTAEGVRPTPLTSADRFHLRQRLRESLVPAGQLLLLLLSPLVSPIAGPLLALSVLLAGALMGQRPAAWPGRLLRLLFLPDSAVAQLCAAGEALLALLLPRRALREMPGLPRPTRFTSPWSQWGSALALVATALLARPVAPLGLIPAVCFAAAPLLLPWLSAPAPVALFDEAQTGELTRMAEETWRFFSQSVTAQTAFLPPQSLQVEPERGADMRSGPGDAGLYLLACVMACELALLDGDELGRRVAGACATLERLPTWHGCPYACYSLPEGTPAEPREVIPADCGYYLAGLTVTAQALRLRLATLDASLRDLPERLDALAGRMELACLTDPGSGLFLRRVDPLAQHPAGAVHDLLADETLLLSFFAVMTRQVPPAHLLALSRTRIRSSRGRVLLSPTGALAEYLAPFLVLPAAPGTLAETTCRNAALAQAQQLHDGLWGYSRCACWAFGPDLRYRTEPFGLRALGRFTETAQDAIAPYAAALALPFAPEEAYEDLQRMRAAGLSGPLGFFESLDLSPARTGTEQTGRVVRAYFARHQAMLLCGLGQVLQNGGLDRILASIPAARPALLLLRRLPLSPAPAPVTLPLPPARPEDPDEELLRRPEPLVFPIAAHALAGRGACLLVNAQGDQHLLRDGVAVTRAALRPGLHEGFQFYLRVSGGPWWQPTDPTLPGSVSFSGATAVFHRERDRLATTLTCLVDPATGAAVQVLTLSNLSAETQQVAVADYFEPALTPAGAACPAANDPLCLSCGRIGGRGVWVQRRTAEPGARPLRLVHELSATVSVPVRVTTDREAFLGAGGTPWYPRSLDEDGAEGFCAAPMEPCVSLRVQVTLSSRATVRLVYRTLLLSPGDELPDAPLRPDAASIDDTFFLARIHLRALRARLGISAEAFDHIGALCGAVLWSGQPHQGSDVPCPPVPSGFGLRPGAPLLLVTLTDPDGALWQLAVQAAALWRHMGLAVDVCFLLPGEAEGEGPLHHRVREALAACLLPDAEGILLPRMRDLNAAAVASLSARAALHLHDRAGTVADQLLRLHQAVAATPVTPPPPSIDPTDSGALRFPCGYGGFDPDGGAYVIRLPAGASLLAPWRNRLTGRALQTDVSERGPLRSLGGENASEPLTACFSGNREPAELLLLRDLETGELLSPCRAPFCQEADVRVTHEAGASTFVSQQAGIECSWQVYADSTEQAGCRALRLKEKKHRKRSLLVLWCIRFGSKDAAHVPCVTALGRCVLASCGDVSGVVCAAMPEGEGVRSCVMSEGALRGLWGTSPAGLTAATALGKRSAEPPLTGASDRGEVGVLSCRVELAPGGVFALPMLLCAERTADAAEHLLLRLRESGLSARLRLVRRVWSTRFSALVCHVPDPALALLLGRVLPYQLHACIPASLDAALLRVFPLSLTDPIAARETLLRHAASLLAPSRPGPGTAGLLLALALAHYVSRSGDRAVLAEPLPGPSPEQPGETLALRCAHFLLGVMLGPRELPLSRPGSLADDMVPPGAESLYLGFLLCLALKRFAPLCPPEESQALSTLRARILKGADAFGWDGQWYLRAVDEQDEPIGTHRDDRYQVDLATQVLAVLSGAPRERSAEALHQACARLFDPAAHLTAAFAPPFGSAVPGLMASAPCPGLGPNGGQDNALSALLIAALADLGESEAAWTLAATLLPMRRADSLASARRYHLEPFALSGGLFTDPAQAGRAYRPWDERSAPLLYAVLLEKLLGVRKRGDRVSLAPLLPPDWEDFAITLPFASATYHLTSTRDAHTALCDGAPLPDGFVTLQDDGRIHEVVFPSGA